MIKVLQIRRNASGGSDGTDNYCRELYGMFSNDAECQVLPVTDIPQTPSLFKYSYNKEVLRRLFAEADIIHVNGYTAYGTIKALKLARRMGKKVVYTAHWHPFECLRRPLLGKLFFNILLKPVIKRCADVVTTINNEDTAFFSSFFDNVVRIPHSYSGTISVAENKKSDMILFVGRINDHVKGFHHILAIPEGKYDIHCVGYGELPTDRRDITLHSGLTKEELGALYDKASLVVIPSRYEAFSYVALEALMHGTPVVMSDKVRIADYLSNTDAVSIFRYGNTDEFLKKIEETIGRRFDVDKISTIFSLDSVTAMYRKVYLSL